MDWQIYKERFNIFFASLSASLFLTFVSSIIFEDFPGNLPTKITKVLSYHIKQLILAYKNKGTLKGLQVDQLDNFLGKYKDFEIISIYKDIWAPYLELYILESDKKNRFQWEKLIISQQLIMIFTFFDAFLSDSIGSICEIKPKVLRRDKQISWRKVLELGDSDSLLHHLIDTYVSELGRKEDIKERLKTLEKEFSLRLKIPEDDKNFLYEAQQIRHLFVHSGGRVTQEFLRRAGSFKKGLKIGDYVNVDLDYLKKLNFIILEAGSKLFLEVSTKFFYISKNKALKFCWIIK